MDAEKDPGRKAYQAAYRLKNGGKVRAWNRAYYRRHREEILARKKSLAQREPDTDGALPEGWTAVFEVRKGVWSWRARRGAAVLENGGFASLREARRDCLRALGD